MDLAIVEGVLLGILQGLTEFLPVSSSGHLVLGKTILGWQETGITFEVFVHFGTLLAVVVVFWRDILNLVAAFFALFRKKVPQKADADRRLLFYLIAATLPAVVIGLGFEDQVEQVFQNPHLVCYMLIVTGLFLLATRFVRGAKKEPTLRNTFLIGVAQAVAILPGISRSGATITTGIFQGLNGETAARFSFLLSVPAILGATILKVSELLQNPISAQYFLVLAAGTLAAFVSGYLAITTLLGIVRRGKLYWFAPYCLILGIIGLWLI